MFRLHLVARKQRRVKKKTDHVKNYVSGQEQCHKPPIEQKDIFQNNFLGGKEREGSKIISSENCALEWKELSLQSEFSLDSEKVCPVSEEERSVTPVVRFPWDLLHSLICESRLSGY